MKKIAFSLWLVFTIALFAFSKPEDPYNVLGRWETTFRTPDGPMTFTYVFKKDSIIDGLLQGKAFVSGKYFMKNDTCWITDPICNSSIWANYKFTFYAQDSIRMTRIKDTCTGRIEGMHNVTIVKIKRPAK